MESKKKRLRTEKLTVNRFIYILYLHRKVKKHYWNKWYINSINLHMNRRRHWRNEIATDNWQEYQ